jgi:TPR repeat protein
MAAIPSSSSDSADTKLPADTVSHTQPINATLNEEQEAKFEAQRKRGLSLLKQCKYAESLYELLYVYTHTASYITRLRTMYALIPRFRNAYMIDDDYTACYARLQHDIADGDDAAYVSLGFCCAANLIGDTTKGDSKRPVQDAIQYYQHAIEVKDNDVVQCLAYLGLMRLYMWCDGPNELHQADWARATIFAKLASQAHPFGRHAYVARLLASGQYETAFELIRQSLEEDDAAIYPHLAYAYLKWRDLKGVTFGPGFKMGQKNVLKWLEKGVELGSALAFRVRAVDLTRRLEKHTEAMHWLRKAAQQGESHCQALLGWMYARGRGADQSDEKTVYWYEKATASHSAYGVWYLSTCYKTGQGVPQDLDTYHELLELAVSYSSSDAMLELARAYLDKLPEVHTIERDDHRAIEILTHAAESLCCAEAAYELGVIYEYGTTAIPANIEKAKYWYMVGARHGYNASAVRAHQLGCDPQECVDTRKQALKKWTPSSTCSIM